MTEQWRAVVGYEGLYEVSDHGRVRSLDRIVQRRDGQTRPVRGRLLVATPNPDTGYLYVKLYRANHGRPRPVHVLVAEAFHGPRPAGQQVCHAPGSVRTDNRAVNLRYDTISANRHDSVTDGTHVWASRDACSRRHRYAGRNLIVRGGHRGCRACERTAQTVRRLRVGGRLVTAAERQAIADHHYQTIMDEVAA